MRKYGRNLLSILLMLVIVLGVMPGTAMAAGLPFEDVPTDAWYYNDVKLAYENDLIDGTSATTYDPTGNLSYAAAVKIAACMYQKTYEGQITLTNSDSGPWYQSYVDYAKSHGIITKDYNWNAMATRAGYMEIFAGALKDSDLRAINSVQDGAIPDVPVTHRQAAGIYKLYRAGIVQGNDAAHNCSPNSMISRGAVAAIVTRMMVPSQRISFSIAARPSTSSGAATGSKPSTSYPDTPATSSSYILNINSKKFHIPNCPSVKRMSQRNKKAYTGSRDAIIAQGYSPCGKCNP